ncbi:NTPase [Roseivirga seohaensis]|uniref:NTPase n=1 Tax=Roseivirga seohaensis TaxID=1914963 RepID=A0A150XYU4_9BACT|nr:P-loop NTPase fold protein [Roseivirga seohaensis]KYG83939.1 NTPase [Roseivirga seohaensis]
MWSDNETTEDLLGYDVHAKLITEVLEDNNLLPITIGVFGDWGSGKSSILKILTKNLENKDEGTFVLYFNGWLFEGYDDAKAALLESILKEFEENKKFDKKVRDKASSMIKSVNWLRIAGLGFKNVVIPAATAYATGGVSLIPYLTQKLGSLSASDISDKLKGDKPEEFLKSLLKDSPNEDYGTVLIRDFREEFKELIETSKIKKLIVVIDDLDRCTTDRIIENLEAIKLFLNVDNTAFVIGADPRIVRHAIRARYRLNDNEEGEVRNNTRIVDDYLEKLIQVPYSLPKLSDSEVETYISLLISKRELEPKSFEKVLVSFKDFRSKNRYGVFGLVNLKPIVTNEEYEQLKSSLGSIPALAPIITQSLYGNPRQIKRFLNTFTLRNKLSKIASISGFNEAVLAKLMILEYTEIDLFRQLYDWQSTQEGKSVQLQELEKKTLDVSFSEAKEAINSGYKLWAKDKVIKWLKVEPYFSEVDLRDYFWLSRDNVASTITGASLISPIVKMVYQKLDQENISASVSRKIIGDEIKPMIDHELEQFLDFAINSIKKQPDSHRAHEIFILLMEEGIPGSIGLYRELLNVMSPAKMPAAIGSSLSEFKSHPDLGEPLTKFFSNSKGKAAKAFNL